MNIAAIQTFLTVIRLGALNRAADALNVTQSTVTARLDALEQSLGATLLVRSRKGAELTKAGYRFLSDAERIVETWSRARKQMRFVAPFAGLFSLGCAPTLWWDGSDRWLRRMRESQPALACEAWPGEPDILGRWLRSGLIDAALSTSALAGDVQSKKPGAADHRPVRHAKATRGAMGRGLRIR